MAMRVNAVDKNSGSEFAGTRYSCGESFHTENMTRQSVMLEWPLRTIPATHIGKECRVQNAAKTSGNDLLAT